MREDVSLDAFRDWVATLDERGPRFSYAAGRVHLEPSAQSYYSHEPVVAAFASTLYRLESELDLGRYFAPPSWFTHEPSALSTEPDGFLVTWPTFENHTMALNPERPIEMLGRPDMALEVVSDASERKDLVEHVHNYAAAGVREYWIADGRGDEPIFRVRVLGPDGAYAEAEPDDQGWIASPLWGRSFRLRRYIDRAGLPDFVLDIR